jgi:energy-coupling factor transport system substrate-specific component
VFSLFTSTAGWDTGRALSTALALAVLGRPVLDVMHRAARRARLS